jgi:preprotein translocase subunit SecG
MIYTVISILILIASVLVILVVLVQNSKGGGLASNFASSNQFMGVRKTADILEKSTWTLGIVILALSLLSVVVINPGTGTTGSKTEKPLIQDMTGSGAQPMDIKPAPADTTKK